MKITTKKALYLSNNSSKIDMWYDEDEKLNIEYIIFKNKSGHSKILLSIHNSINNNKLIKNETEITIISYEKEIKLKNDSYRNIISYITIDYFDNLDSSRIKIIYNNIYYTDIRYLLPYNHE